MLTSESFHLKSAKEVQNYTVPAQILMKMHICDPCDPNRKNPIFFLTSYFQIYGTFKFYENVNFRVNSLFKNPHCTKHISHTII